MPAVKNIQKFQKNTLQSFPHLNECLRKCCSTADPMLKLYRPKMLKHTCEAKEKKLLVSVWAPGWDFFSDYAAGKFLPKQQVN